MGNPMTLSSAQAYDELIKRNQEYSLLGSCAGVLGWDERTYMPRKGSALRANQIALLARLAHGLRIDARVGELLTQLGQSDLVGDPDSAIAANIREIRRSYDRAIKMPPDLVEEIARVTTRAQQVWQDARQANDFRMFQPWLERIVSLKRRQADAVGYEQAPYDALLDEYEPGAKAGQVTEVFTALRSELVPLVRAITSSRRQPRRDVIEREFPIERQQFFGQAAAAAIGFDFDGGRLDVTTHPFCSGMGPGDCRITTRYNPRRFNDAFFGVLHEAGHGIYEQGLAPDQFGTPLGEAASLGIHESQSRAWENFVGRSRPFWDHFFPRAQQVFGSALHDVSLDDFYFAVNEVRPSFIRVEADEVTYNMHVILRFELEQELMTGALLPSDVPTAWNEKFQGMLGLRPPSDALGCLQDVHWSFGGIGYFPTYTLGNMYAAQFMEQAHADLPELEGDFRRGSFARLKDWLNERIHRHGQRYRAADLCRRVTGKPLSHRPLVQYLQHKYAALYGV
jgi:carboxypeptidase Taq